MSLRFHRDGGDRGDGFRFAHHPPPTEPVPASVCDREPEPEQRDQDRQRRRLPLKPVHRPKSGGDDGKVVHRRPDRAVPRQCHPDPPAASPPCSQMELGKPSYDLQRKQCEAAGLASQMAVSGLAVVLSAQQLWVSARQCTRSGEQMSPQPSRGLKSEARVPPRAQLGAALPPTLPDTLAHYTTNLVPSVCPLALPLQVVGGRCGSVHRQPAAGPPQRAAPQRAVPVAQPPWAPCRPRPLATRKLCGAPPVMATL